MMEHAEHSPAAIREKAAGAVNCQSVTLPSGLTVLCRTDAGLQLGTRHVRHQLWLRCAGIYP